MCLFLSICVSVSMHLIACSSKVVFSVLGGKECIANLKLIVQKPWGSKFGHLYFVHMWSVSSVKVEQSSSGTDSSH